MKRVLLLLGFVVFWKQWEAWHDEPILLPSHAVFDTLLEAREFTRRHKKDERYTDMHIYRIGEEVQP